ncbi:MAG: Hpt domain-containing protein [Chloroflexi bacterium]|nr:Hpt domain-containing protein [Chloroflexota bacterium]
MSGPIDEATFDRLVEMTGGELDFVDELVDTYLEEADGQVTALRAALERDDQEALIRAAHSLKSGSLNVGALELGEACRGLEEGLRQGRIADAQELVTDIAAGFAEARTALLGERERRAPL